MNPLKEVETQIEIEFPCKIDAEIALKAIEPEIRDSPSERTRTGIECREKNSEDNHHCPGHTISPGLPEFLSALADTFTADSGIKT